jgi:hypothetical protein
MSADLSHTACSAPDHHELIAEALWRVRVTAELAERYVLLDDHIGLARSLGHLELYAHVATASFDAISLETARQKFGGRACKQDA